MKKLDFSKIKGITLAPPAPEEEASSTEEQTAPQVVASPAKEAAPLLQSPHEWEGQEEAIVVVGCGTWAAFYRNVTDYRRPQGGALFGHYQKVLPLEHPISDGVYEGVVEIAPKTSTVRLLSYRDVTFLTEEAPWGRYQIPDCPCALAEPTGTRKYRFDYKNAFGWAMAFYAAWVLKNTQRPNSETVVAWFAQKENAVEMMRRFIENDGNPIVVGPLCLVPKFELSYQKDVILTVQATKAPNHPLRDHISIRGYDGKCPLRNYPCVSLLQKEEAWIPPRRYRRPDDDGLAYVDGRWVRFEDAPWCDPDWTSGD